ADVARAAGIECMLGAMMEPRISITAAAHLAIAHPAITMIDLDPPAWFASDVPRGGYLQDGAWLRLAGGAGPGREPLEAHVDRARGGRCAPRISPAPGVLSRCPAPASTPASSRTSPSPPPRCGSSRAPTAPMWTVRR